MTNFAAQSDPSRNPRFNRTWTDDPLQLPDLQHLGCEIAPKVVQDVGRRAIGCWLGKASETHGAVAAEAFRQADLIRRKLGLDWTELIHEQEAA